MDNDKIKGLIRDKNLKIYRAIQTLTGESQALLSRAEGDSNIVFSKELPDDHFFRNARDAIAILNQNFHELNAIRNVIK